MASSRSGYAAMATMSTTHRWQMMCRSQQAQAPAATSGETTSIWDVPTGVAEEEALAIPVGPPRPARQILHEMINDRLTTAPTAEVRPSVDVSQARLSTDPFAWYPAEKSDVAPLPADTRHDAYHAGARITAAFTTSVADKVHRTTGADRVGADAQTCRQ